jgi:hypothetical protein
MKKLLIVGLMFAEQVSFASEGLEVNLQKSFKEPFNLEKSLEDSKRYNYLKKIQGFGYNPEGDELKKEYNSILEIITNQRVNHAEQGFKIYEYNMTRPEEYDANGQFLEKDLQKSFKGLANNEKPLFGHNQSNQKNFMRALHIEAVGDTPSPKGLSKFGLAQILCGGLLAYSSDNFLISHAGTLMMKDGASYIVSNYINKTLISTTATAIGCAATFALTDIALTHPVKDQPWFSPVLAGAPGLLLGAYSAIPFQTKHKNKQPEFDMSTLQQAAGHESKRKSSLKVQEYYGPQNQMTYDINQRKFVPRSSSKE